MARCDLTLLNFLPILGAIFSQMRQYLSTYSLLKLSMMQGVVNLCECQRISWKYGRAVSSPPAEGKNLAISFAFRSPCTNFANQSWIGA